MFRRNKSLRNTNDPTLVLHSLGGDRDSFCEIVSRYQNLLCSIAYSAVGDLKQSEDLAQETFIEAWKKLDTLKDPEKLKAWLCGILRFKVSHFRRKQDNHLSSDEVTEESLSGQVNTPELDEDAIASQQEALMWKVLNQMDPIYREPLVLFYREQESIESVASALELSEDTVKQRLSRGRKLLKSAMSVFVEDALSRSKPGTAFTVGVLTIINTISPPAKAAMFGVSASKSSAWIKLPAMLAMLASVSGLISSYFGLRAGLDQSRTQRERQFVKRTVWKFLGMALLYVIAMLGLKEYTIVNPEQATTTAFISQLVVLALLILYCTMTIKMNRNLKALRARERLFEPEAFTAAMDQKGAAQREYISRLCLFGIPLIHYQFGIPEQGDKPAIGWIAGGSYAYGLLFAWGGVAIAPVSVGIVSFGVITVGAIGIGLLSAGTIALGILAFGASAIGLKAYSSLSSLGWESALSGGFAIANDAALGAIVFAKEANTDIARQIVSLSAFDITYPWVLATISILVILPAVIYAKLVRKRMKKA